MGRRVPKTTGCVRLTLWICRRWQCNPYRVCRGFRAANTSLDVWLTGRRSTRLPSSVLTGVAHHSDSRPGSKNSPYAPMNLGVDSLSILFSHRSFQKPAISPGFWRFSRKKDPWKECGSSPWNEAMKAWGTNKDSTVSPAMG